MTVAAEGPQGRDRVVRGRRSTGGDGSVRPRPFTRPVKALEKMRARRKHHSRRPKAGTTARQSMGVCWSHRAMHGPVFSGRSGGTLKGLQDRRNSCGRNRTHDCVPPLPKGPTRATKRLPFQGLPETIHMARSSTGVVSDKSTVNKYHESGRTLRTMNFATKMVAVWLAESGLLVRNSVFVNSTESARSVPSGGQTTQ